MPENEAATANDSPADPGVTAEEIAEDQAVAQAQDAEGQDSPGGDPADATEDDAAAEPEPTLTEFHVDGAHLIFKDSVCISKTDRLMAIDRLKSKIMGY